MSQSRRMSLVEAIANVAVGFAVALLTQLTLFPAMGVRLPLDRHLLISFAFTCVSLARSYCLRRIFVRLDRERV